MGQLEAHLALVHGEGGVLEYEDEAIDRRILIRYAGDAKFKGVRSSLPVYEAGYQGRASMERPSVERLFTPWRMAYVTSGGTRRPAACCAARATARAARTG